MATSTSGPGTAVASIRSLADDLRSRDAEDLVQLLQDRADLAVPVAPDLATLAVRATTRASVARALDQLSAPELQVIEVLAALPEPASAADVARLWDGDTDAVLRRLHELALVWVGEDGLRLVRMARDLVGPAPAGLGPPLAEALDRRSPAGLAELGERVGIAASGDPDTIVARVAGALSDPQRVAALLTGAPDGAGRILERLAWGPPVGLVPSGTSQGGTGTGAAVNWLLRHGMLAAADDGRVVLPREVGLALRGGRVHRAAAAPPALDGQDLDPALVERTAAGAAAEAVRLVAQVLGVLDRQRVPVLRTGGLGVRELRRLASALGGDEAVAARAGELAFGAGLVLDDGEADPSFVLTGEADEWLDADVPDRWTTLARAWASGSRVASLVGARDSSGAVRAAWSDTVERPASRELRGQVLELLAQVPPGRAVGVDVLLARLTHQAPRREAAGRADLVRALLDDMAFLGITAMGALSPAGRALLTPVGSRSGEPVAAALRLALPQPVERLVLQGDLTAVAPGPLVAWLDAEMGLLADVESPGAATVYRFTPDSIRRALDAGRDARTILDVLSKASGGTVPQPLDYLVRDAARRHGVLRVGTAAAYIRSDDEAALAEILADRRAAGLGLRSVAPTVLVSATDPASLLRSLRAMGASPVPEGDGAVVQVTRPARRPPARRAVLADPPPSPQRLREAVERWRVVDAGPRPDTSALPRMEPAVSLSVLRLALDTNRRVWIGYVDETGRATQRLVVPRSLQAGRLAAEEVGRSGSRLFSVHRVTGAVLEDEVLDGAARR